MAFSIQPKNKHHLNFVVTNGLKELMTRFGGNEKFNKDLGWHCHCRALIPYKKSKENGLEGKKRKEKKQRYIILLK